MTTIVTRASNGAPLTNAQMDTNLTNLNNDKVETSVMPNYALLADPTFTGVPKAPTATPGTNTTQLATTAFAATLAAGKAPLTGEGTSGTWPINVTGNAATATGQSFAWANTDNSPTYLWCANTNGSAYLAARGSISVNYANSAGTAGNISGNMLSDGDHGMLNSAASAWKFRVDASGNAFATANVVAFASDERLKENFTVIENALDKVAAIGGYSFDWKMDKCLDLGFNPGERHQHGVKAQDVQKIIPDAVHPAPFDYLDGKSKSGEDYLTVDYAKLVPLLLAAITELRTEVEALKNGNST